MIYASVYHACQLSNFRKRDKLEKNVKKEGHSKKIPIPYYIQIFAIRVCFKKTDVPPKQGQLASMENQSKRSFQMFQGQSLTHKGTFQISLIGLISDTSFILTNQQRVLIHVAEIQERNQRAV